MYQSRRVFESFPMFVVQQWHTVVRAEYLVDGVSVKKPSIHYRNCRVSSTRDYPINISHALEIIHWRPPTPYSEDYAMRQFRARR